MRPPAKLQGKPRLGTSPAGLADKHRQAAEARPWGQQEARDGQESDFELVRGPCRLNGEHATGPSHGSRASTPRLLLQ